MKFKNLFLIAISVAALLVACGSDKKAKSTTNEVTNEVTAEATDVQELVQQVEQVIEDGDSSIPGYIVISKESMTLKLYDKNGKIIYNFPVAVGKNYGNKQVSGDMKTPEGVFEIQQIQPASTWSHDFKDGKGPIPHAYGDWFIRLLTPPHRGIGIHGTHAPESIGTRATEGCIRLHNENLNKLKPLLRIGMKVTIETSQKDLDADGKEQLPVTKPKTEVTPTQEVKEQPVTKVEAPATETKPTTEAAPATETKPATETTTTEVATGDIIEHTIENGQFLSHVAVKYNTTTAKILELNPGVEPTKIRPGQKIKVQPNTDKKPEKPVVEEDPNGTYHKVEKGEFLGTIAKKYDTTVAKIKELNNMESDFIRTGQKIRVK